MRGGTQVDLETQSDITVWWGRKYPWSRLGGKPGDRVVRVNACHLLTYLFKHASTPHPPPPPIKIVNEINFPYHPLLTDKWCFVGMSFFNLIEKKKYPSIISCLSI